MKNNRIKACIAAIILAFSINAMAQKKVDISIGVNYLITHSGVSHMKIGETWTKVIGTPSVKDTPLSLRLSALYRINEAVSLGLGVRVESNTLPVYLSTEVRPMVNKNIFLYADLGYGFEFDSFYKGLLAEVGVGYFFKLNKAKKNGLGIKLGNNYKNMKKDNAGYKKSLHSISLGVYYTF